jgi:hypothetical protein
LRSLLSLLMLSLSAAIPPGDCLADTPLTLTEEMAIDVSGESVARRLVDEQSLIGDPAGGSGGQPKTEWTLGWTNWETIHPIEAVIDLGRAHRLSAVSWYDGTGHEPLEVSVWSDGAWKPIAEDSLDAYQTWTTKKTDAATRYVRFLQRKPGGAIHEIALYGTPSGEAPAKTPSPGPRPQPVTMDRFIGTNGFIVSPLARVAKIAGVMREYHQWQWDEGNVDPDYRGGLPAWSPSWVSGPGWGWDFDDFYAKAKAAGVEIQPVIQGTLPYLVDGQAGGNESHPLTKDRPTEDPQSYLEHSRHFYQFAARYGQTKVSPESIVLRDGQEKKSGLGLVNWVENWNEPDKTWRSRSGRFRPWELMAMCSADYDGHRGALGSGRGMKAADPKMKMLSGGLFKVNLDYLKAMKLWCDLHRDGSFPGDGIALHHYCRTHESLSQGESQSPEAHNLLAKLKAVLAWRDANFPHLEIWFGEFGYDTHPASPQVARSFPGQSIEQTQGLWMVRTMLIAAEAGVDRAQMYMLADVDEESRTQFDTGGLLHSQKQGYAPKPSYYHMATLRAMLKGLQLDRTFRPESDGLHAQRYTGDRTVYVVWADEKQAEAKPTISVPTGKAKSVRMVRMTDDSETGVSSELKSTEGTIDVSGGPSPVFIELQ